MTSWHVSIHACDTRRFAEKAISWHGQTFYAVDIDATRLDQPFPVAFESFIRSVNGLAGGYAEGDGSFGICGPAGKWKICGTIFEVNDWIHYVELMGHCPRQTLIELIARLGANVDACVFQIMQGGFFVTFPQFWKLIDESSARLRRRRLV